MPKKLDAGRSMACRDLVTDTITRFSKRNPDAPPQEIALALIEVTAAVTGTIACPECRLLAANNAKLSLTDFLQVALDLAVKKDPPCAKHVH